MRAPGRGIGISGLPPAAALGVASVGGVASALQSAANASLGEKVGNASFGAVVNVLSGSAIVLIGLLTLPSMRTGLRALRGSRLPWWAYLGGLGGGTFVTVATYVVPVIGVAAFTIAQVTGGSLGGLAVDRSGLAPTGRLALNRRRVAGALLGIAAVALAQAGRPLGEAAAWALALGVLGGAAVAVQAALNGRVSAASTTAAGTAVNFATAAPAVLIAATVLGAFAAGWSSRLPGQWYLYTGGALGVLIVVCLLVSVRAVGVLRTGLSVVAGQLAGALLLDTVLPNAPGPTPSLLAGAALTIAAVAITRPPRTPRT